MLEFVGVNVLSSAHVRVYTSEKCPFVVGWLRSGGVRSPCLPLAERRSSTEAANKEVVCELKQCDKRKQA